ncbi:ADP-ribose pyrophosphatase, mitochondrial [Belonocnema kinseyi]|uniref:ADP-ribose pyrophosphatase, mitochondrial n=1 Tax=Belonocnema kinseyi TaxID=2817044 RepID=UPI00143D9CD7|nr:ADP-ribose pyrophosphatase, mitochondrial [Belonocnema kinseyi]XP_033222429.1 ADP-ribose pyrophosphatase, mitochondrial [Belonocnema kinseyi]
MRGRVAKMIHQKCTRGLYPSSNVQRFEVPEDKVAWSVEFPEYEPVEFNSPVLKGKPWADPEIDDPSFEPKWNSIDGKVNRESYTKNYELNDIGQPQNPIGRTGIVGRGLLGRWGPNHAADPIVTRWKRNSTGALEIDRKTEKPILQFVAIERRDSKNWAIPGGMVDPGEQVSETLKREFMEEALNALEKSAEEKEEMEVALKKFFDRGDEVYRGYVDDSRNTDNAWMETIALNFHDEDGSTVGEINLKAGDDASNVRWMDVDKQLNLFANHVDFIKQTAHKRNAHW